MNKYIKYFNYIMEHKKNVFIECWKEKLYIHAFTHDLSKFSPKEFFAYAEYFYGDYGIKIEKDFSGDNEPYTNGLSCLSRSYLECKGEFNNAWEHHYKHNKHHWNCWIGKPMPQKYIKQMICDWKAMSRKFGDTPQEFYMKNYDKITLETGSRCLLEFELGLIDGCCMISNFTWKDYCKRQNITMEDDLKSLGYIKEKTNETI